MGHQVGIFLIFAQYAIHAFQNACMNIAGHITEVCWNITLDQRTVHFTALMINFLHDPHAAGNRNLVPDRGGFDNGAKLLGTGADRIFHVFLEHGVEFVIVYNPLTGQTDNQSTVFRAVDMVDLNQMS